MNTIRMNTGIRRTMAVTAIAVMATTVAACGDDSASDAPTTKHPVATIEVAGKETFKIELDTPELVAHARELLAGGEEGRIPNGIVVRDSPSVNAPWSWHIDPATLEWADMTTEVCDGLPSDVQDGLITSDRYCPWQTTVISIDG
jgi:hypothetical protein